MLENYASYSIIMSPVLFVIIAIASRFQSGFRPKLILAMSQLFALLSIVIAAFSGLLVYKYGLLETELLGISNLGLSLRLDSLSVLMFGMIALLGFIIIKYSCNYLDGDQRQGSFIGRLAATIAAVQLLVLSGNLALLLLSWIFTSMSLHRLLVFYPDRPGARIAARKKFIVARLGDASLFISIAMLYSQFGTGNLEVIFNAIKTASAADLPALNLEGPALFLVLAAVLKSAQFPTHGWLVEVMETPTPVSALLHAGLLNAGPFLIVRMATVMDASMVSPVILMVIGGFTALFGSVVFLTQTSVKTALGYSSVAHMGFSLLACGLGVYSAAILHLVAHSFYKAHAFLSSGSVIDSLKASKIATPTKSINFLQMLMGIILATALYAGIALLWGMNLQNDAALLVIGAVIMMGLSRIFTSAISSKGSSKLIFQATLMGAIVTTAFFSLEFMTHYLLSSQIPEAVILSSEKLGAAAVLLTVFALAVILQIMSLNLAEKPWHKAMAIHLRNGFYANAIFDKLIGALHIPSGENKQEAQEQFDLKIEPQVNLIKNPKRPLYRSQIKQENKLTTA